MSKFPDIASLAGATDDEVMRAWQGLGYYSRARNLHEAARQVMERHAGQFPGSYEEIRALKGIGDYTAAAIGSISFRLPYPVIDGNVTRFIARYLGIERPAREPASMKKIRSWLETQLDQHDPGSFNQAVMEFGALVCKPRQPGCIACTFSKECLAYRSGKVDRIPLLEKVKDRRRRFFHYLVVLSEDGGKRYTWMKKRTGNDIWRNLYDFPLLESAGMLETGEVLASGIYRDLAGNHEMTFLHASPVNRHLLTHRELFIRFFVFSSPGFHHAQLTRLETNRLGEVPLPRIIEKFIAKMP